MAEPPSTEITAASKFGVGLRAWRTSSLRDLEAKQHTSGFGYVLSKSQLHRYEIGETLPNLNVAQHLDRLYDADGWVEMALRSLWRPAWTPWRDEHRPPRRLHAGSWPAGYGGPVWVKVLPHPETLRCEHVIVLEWGPWKREVRWTPDDIGLVLVTGKAPDADGVSRTCNVSVNYPVFVLFGAGDELSGEVVRDIRSGWVLVDEP